MPTILLVEDDRNIQQLLIASFAAEGFEVLCEVDGLRAIERVRRILESRRGALEAIARKLMETEVIDGAELRGLVEASVEAPQLAPGTDAEPRSPRHEGRGEVEPHLPPGEASKA